MRISYSDFDTLASASAYGWEAIPGWEAELNSILQSAECRFLPLKTFRYACVHNDFRWAASVYFNQSDKLEPSGLFNTFLERTITDHKNFLDS
jgi:hypothetical protein